ncbi:MAG TPA: threonylcarbamoyl-AMP synthase [Candidatus Monoglobus merdigallinarum]|uniref:L-threonylcarbamoyladenylate synthase n=1 Tax=Candidatus Monoglobus merdigallinarum TaxID=2838698 RepID=A0A9D1TMD8_9FIRM|nr:threonylcarbamoyl-AMP synthase [Candidatus Monoglobus merdigallinarum]
METKLLSANGRDLKTAAEIITGGGTVIFPTETVYGLGADALNPEAVRKIFKAKGRPGDNPLIVHVHDIKQVDTVAEEVPEKAKMLMEHFWPGPLTVILKRRDSVPDEVTAGLKTVGVRMPSDRTALEFLKLTGRPVAAPSANLSGKPSPTSFKHCVEDMSGRVDAIIDGGDCAVGVESTVIDMTASPVIYRPGDITAGMIEDVLKEKVTLHDSVADGETPKSPGLKYKHYSPAAEVVILKGSVDEVIDCVNRQSVSCGIIVFDQMLETVKNGLSRGRVIKTLGDRKSPRDAEANLFRVLRDMDEMGVRVIFAPEIPDNDKWAAVRNRLYRAAGNRVASASEFEFKSAHEKPKRFLFVCTGNTCRSPMAEGLFNEICRRRGIAAASASAGLSVAPGSVLSENSLSAMKRENIDISGHVPTALSLDMLKEFDVVLTMSSSHKQMLKMILSGNSELSEKVFTLGEYSGLGIEISDPYGGDISVYESCLKEIKKCVAAIADKLSYDKV